NNTGTQLVYATYLGGGGKDVPSSIAVNSFGSVYVTGETNSTDFPITANAFQRTFAGGSCYNFACGDGFVVKLNPTGTGLLYSTYLGGSLDEYSNGIAIDAQGNAYVTGASPSTNFPSTPGAYQTALKGGANAFIVKVLDDTVDPVSVPKITD